MLSIFSCAFWPSVCLLWRNVYLIFCPLFDWVVFLILSCMSCLYILEINPLLVDSFANIFCHSVGCLFVLLMILFTLQTLLSLLRSHLFLFSLLSEVDQKRYCWNLCQRVFCLMFSSKSFIVYGITFRSLIHFEFIFMYSVRECSNFIILYVAVQFSQNHLLKKMYFLHSIFFFPCHRLIDCKNMGLFLGSLFCSIDLRVCFCISTMLFYLL